MASFTIFYRSSDKHSELNGSHAPVDSGAAFMAQYGHELEHGDGTPVTAESIDAMGIGCSVTIEGNWCETLTVTREA